LQDRIFYIIIISTAMVVARILTHSKRVLGDLA
jgi:hypothetical protein